MASRARQVESNVTFIVLTSFDDLAKTFV